MDLSDITIREAERSDMDDLVGLLRELFSIEEDFTFDETRQRRGLEMMLENPAIRCIKVADAGQKVIGMCSAQLFVSTADGKVAGLLEDMVINPAYRSMGIGRNLLASVETWANENGADRLQLLADQNNAAALEFYEKTAWKRTQLICLRKKREGV